QKQLSSKHRVKIRGRSSFTSISPLFPLRAGRIKELCALPISKILKISGLLAGVASLALAGGCGGGTKVVIPHPTGNYSNASFKGSYVYEIHGILSNNNPYREAGVITADGNG